MAARRPITGCKPQLSLEVVRMLQESHARRKAEPTIAEWAQRLGVTTCVVRRAMRDGLKTYWRS